MTEETGKRDGNKKFLSTTVGFIISLIIAEF